MKTKMNNWNYIDIVNAINAETGGMYNYEFPIVDSDNFAAMSAVYTNLPPRIQSAYLDNLYFLNFKVIIHKVYRGNNIFKFLYGDSINETGDGGQQLQEVAIDQFIPLAYTYTPNPDSFFADAPPKVRTQIMANTLRKRYEVTRNEHLVAQAFDNESSFGRFWNAISDRMMQDIEEDDKDEVMAMINASIEGGNMFLVPMTRPVDTSTAIQFSRDFEILVYDLNFDRSRRFNLAGLSTKSSPENAFTSFAGDVVATMNNYNLAWAFHENYLDLAREGRITKVSSKGFARNRVFGIYTSEDFFKIHPIKGFPKIKMWENGETLTEKQWVHVWKFMQISYHNNALAFCELSDIGVDTIELKTVNDITQVKKGKFLQFTTPNVVALDGPDGLPMLADAYLDYSFDASTTPTDPLTRIDECTGDIYVGPNETLTQLIVTGVHHIDKTKSASLTIDIVS